MDSKKNLKKEVELVLAALHKKIDFLKEKVDKLCETTDCWDDGHHDKGQSESKKD